MSPGGGGTRIAQIMEKTPWADIESSVQAIDYFISRLEFVLAPQVKELASEGWPAWLDGRVSDEVTVDPATLNHSETLLLIAALVHDIKLNWRAGSDLTSSANVLEAFLATFDPTGATGTG
jgi:hypothetical protein